MYRSPISFFPGNGEYRRLRAYVHAVNSQYSEDMRNQGQTVEFGNEAPDPVDEGLSLAKILEGRAHHDQVQLTEAEFSTWIKQV
jgi:hypothetical protein